MAWYRFTADHIFTPAVDRRWSIKFKAGHTGPLTREQAEHATRAGVVVEVPTPPSKRSPRTSRRKSAV